MKLLLIAYDNESHAGEFPLNLGYLASVSREAGHDVSIYNQDVFHYPKEHLKNYLDNNKFDVIGLSLVGGYWQYQKLLEISETINSSRHRKDFLYLLGGHGPMASPKYFLEKSGADICGIGEGENTILDILNYYEFGGNLISIGGIAYFDNETFIQTKPCKQIKNLDTIPYPAWDLFPVNHYVMSPFPRMRHTDRTFPVITSRGCPYNCVFCQHGFSGYRTRSVDNVLNEIQELHDKYNITYIAFYDELLMSSTRRVEEICGGLNKLDLNLLWCCDGRLNFASKKNLETMKDAGCVFINYGIESLDETVLKNINKHLTIQQIYNGIENTIDAGISPGLNFIWGNPGDNRDTLWKSVKFILKYTDYSQFRTIRPVTPYPGCQLYYDAVSKGMIKDVKDFYEKKHTNSDLLSVNFTDMSDNEFYKELYHANKILMTNYYNHQMNEAIQTAEKLYIKRDPNFRGYRHT